MPKLTLLKTEKDFSAFRKSQSYHSKLLTLRVHFAANQNFPRFGFIVPKKVLAKATARNLVKRRIKNLLVKVQPRLKPADLLFFPKAGLVKIKFGELEEIVNKLFTDARLWKS
ncbi:MAG: ribonuclease P protein component [Candidatus Doudnabacteria bacterium RIFCSPLOWO2_02_FULL_49_13]|uniref:Ribonuclease P protein component n=1 Tax=Candidatus Doudnabacteria bacterium RIFCSPHIGHO2_12_FULL_48_16 TaxID=1817838 RepID=A0A1F5PK66_9BACT|nr:MAG: ribonuclease P protein component [Candidatus Doudnabacteria bacterium RIFCSPHIGHO2_02_FULL_49_24]OGE88543.1 MAG: ribonuclease P protein component [Candidatus Doudnabacteria bacterium RIFCSPHIGHO2_01_FULL_50_67]OGE90291.1 MAG: ribonuclease P protein component [Candidatus Doudnabacteria bacterium RIFCSPHIGHO2_12_FULL_48_16]OGE96947.1 MAG: ribonuclease P protein component [Candidatus Doudnabacteria bacterium RIFCSPLOWO2_01_FULL_49_40]OGF02347.1 MAG: ribonuclease P protein component [Candid